MEDSNNDFEVGVKALGPALVWILTHTKDYI